MAEGILLLPYKEFSLYWDKAVENRYLSEILQIFNFTDLITIIIKSKKNSIYYYNVEIIVGKYSKQIHAVLGAIFCCSYGYKTYEQSEVYGAFLSTYKSYDKVLRLYQ